MFVEANGVRHFVLEAGAGDPAIVLVHANGVDHAAWHHQIAYFSARTKVYAVDVRGHGHSTKDPQERYDQVTLANDLLAVLDALDLKAPVLVGWSVGALMATRVAANHPDRASAVVLVDNAPAADKIGLDQSGLGELISLMDRDFDGEGARQYVGQWFPSATPESDAIREWCLAMTLKAGKEPVLGIRKLGAPADRLDLLASLRMPVLFTQAGASPMGRQMGEYIHGLVPGSELHVFEGEGHALPMTAPAAFNAVVADFLNRRIGASL